MHYKWIFADIRSRNAVHTARKGTIHLTSPSFTTATCTTHSIYTVFSHYLHYLQYYQIMFSLPGRPLLFLKTRSWHYSYFFRNALLLNVPTNDARTSAKESQHCSLHVTDNADACNRYSLQDFMLTYRHR